VSTSTSHASGIRADGYCFSVVDSSCAMFINKGLFLTHGVKPSPSSVGKHPPVNLIHL